MQDQIKAPNPCLRLLRIMSGSQRHTEEPQPGLTSSVWLALWLATLTFIEQK